jgi:quinol monooxygenase YgiN
MYTHVLELTAKPGQTGQLVRALRDHALPQVIRPSEGFVDEIVLVSDRAPNQVTSISFWRSQQDGERFYATGFARVSAMLQAYMAAPPERRDYTVAASTEGRIAGWNS